KSIQEVCRAVFYAYIPDESPELVYIKCIKTNLFKQDSFPMTAYTMLTNAAGKTVCVFLDENGISKGVQALQTQRTVHNPCATDEETENTILRIVGTYSEVTQTMIVQALSKYCDRFRLYAI